MSNEPTPIDDDAAEPLVASYDATGPALDREAEAKAAGMMTDEFLCAPSSAPRESLAVQRRTRCLRKLSGEALRYDSAARLVLAGAYRR